MRIFTTFERLQLPVNILNVLFKKITNSIKQSFSINIASIIIVI
jgi:hypothetical protein